MISFIVTAAFLVVCVAALRPLWRAGDRRALWVGSILTLSGYSILISASMGHYLPSPLKPLSALVTALFHL